MPAIVYKLFPKDDKKQINIAFINVCVCFFLLFCVWRRAGAPGETPLPQGLRPQNLPRNLHPPRPLPPTPPPAAHLPLRGGMNGLSREKASFLCAVGWGPLSFRAERRNLFSPQQILSSACGLLRMTKKRSERQRYNFPGPCVTNHAAGEEIGKGVYLPGSRNDSGFRPVACDACSADRPIS